MINILAIAYYYNVEKSSTGQILRRFFPELPESEFRVTIISNKTDDEFKNPKHLRIINVKESALGIYTEKVLRNLGLNDLMMTPDYYRYSWGIKALFKARSLCKQERFDYVHTISFPSSSHLIGNYLKNNIRIPWIAQFYDPWHNNPFRPIRSAYFIKKDAYYESNVADNADLIILPCQELVQDWKERYGYRIEEKLLELPFIAGEVDEIKPHSKHKKLIISQIGSSNSKRHSDTFIKAISDLKKEYPNLSEELTINYVGYLTEIERELVKRHELSDIINIVGQITESECSYYFENTDIFLAVDANIVHNYFFPSKLLKYYNYQKPILGLTTPNSVLERELIQSKNVYFHNDDIEGIKKYILKAINDYQSVCTNDVNYKDNFSANMVLSRYKKSVEDKILRLI